jgi:hypothetical protein
MRVAIKVSFELPKDMTPRNAVAFIDAAVYNYAIQWAHTIDRKDLRTELIRKPKEPECRPFDLPHGKHDWHKGQCGRCGQVRGKPKVKP